MKCQTQDTKSGKPCSFEAGPSGLCHLHDPERVEEGLAEQRRRAQLGGQKVKEGFERVKEERRETCRLRSMDDILTELERAMLALENAPGATVLEREVAKVKIISEARATLKAADLENENKQLRELLIEKHPELRKQLKAVK